MSGPRGLVKCCLKVLGFELPSCLVKGFFPLLSSISIFYKEHGEGTRICISKSSLLSCLYPGSPCLRPIQLHSPLHFRGWGTGFRGCGFNSSSTRPRRDEKDEFVLSETGSSVSFLVGEAGSHVLAGPSRHLFPELCLEGPLWHRTCL